MALVYSMLLQIDPNEVTYFFNIVTQFLQTPLNTWNFLHALCTLQSHLFSKFTALFCPSSCFWRRCYLNLVCKFAIDLVAGKLCLTSSPDRDCCDFSIDWSSLIVFSISWYSIMSGSVSCNICTTAIIIWSCYRIVQSCCTVVWLWHYVITHAFFAWTSQHKPITKIGSLSSYKIIWSC